MCINPWLNLTATTAHLIIAGCYLTAPIVLRRLRLSRTVNITATTYLILGGAAHMLAALPAIRGGCHPFWVAVAAGQAITFPIFLISFHRLLTAADRHRKGRRRRRGGTTGETQ